MKTSTKRGKPKLIWIGLTREEFRQIGTLVNRAFCHTAFVQDFAICRKLWVTCADVLWEHAEKGRK